MERCKNVELPNITSVPPDLLPTPTTTPIPSDIPAPPDDDKNGLSGGAIAGIVVGSIAAIALLVFFLFWRRRRQAQGHEGYLNRPSPMRNSPQRNMGYAGGEAAEEHRGYEVLAGGRIARMSALEAANASVSDGASPPPVALGTRGRREGSHRVIHNNSTEFAMDDSPNTGRRTKYSTPERESRPPRPPPRDRNASLSSTSILVSDHHHSDSEKEGSPVVTSPASEQLPYFKDYYSKDDIHPNDKVACLWAYSPRAADEFELERGDMLQVIGIWDDGKMPPSIDFCSFDSNMK